MDSPSSLISRELPLLDESVSFQPALHKALSSAKTIQPKLPWGKIRKLSKEERVNMVTEFFKNLTNDEKELHVAAVNIRKNLTIGLNNTSRSLEKNELSCCLLSGEAKPKLLISHIVDLAKRCSTPVLILNNFKAITKDSLGISSLAIGFKKETMLSQDHQFHLLCHSIINIYNETYGSANKHTTILDCPSSVEEIKVVTDQHHATKQVNLEEIYLYRTSTNYRVFRPSVLCSDESGDMGLRARRGSGGGRSHAQGAHHQQSSLLGCGVPDSSISTENFKTRIEKKRHYETVQILKVQSNPKKRRKIKKNVVP